MTLATTPTRAVATDEPARNLGSLLIDTTADDGRFVVIHTLRTVTGVNMNRDFNGLPKRITYGGCDRLRLSSQAQLRAARIWSREYLAPHDQAARTRNLPNVIATILENEYGHDAAQAGYAAAAVVASTGMGIDWNRPGLTTAIMFLPTGSADRLARLIHEHWAELAEPRRAAQTMIDAQVVGKSKKAKNKKTAAADDTVDAAADGTGTASDSTEDTGRFTDLVPAQLSREALSAYDPAHCIDLALYGRMLANIPDSTVRSAVQVAHAMSVDPLAEVNDEFVVVDDWQHDDVFGAANIGSTYLASGTLYGFAALDRQVLRETLGAHHSDVESMAQLAEQIFIAAMAWSVPGGMRTRTGSAALPTLVIAGATDMPVTATPAFETPVAAPAGVAGAERLCQYHRNVIARVAPLNGGCALWLSPDGTDAPPLPDGLKLL